MHVRWVAHKLRYMPTYLLYLYIRKRIQQQAKAQKREPPSSEKLSAHFDLVFLVLMAFAIACRWMWQYWKLAPHDHYHVFGFAATIGNVVLALIAVFRCVEVPAAFLVDALERLDSPPKSEAGSEQSKAKRAVIGKSQRIELAIGAYFEVILNYAFLYSMLPAKWWGEKLLTVGDSLYFSVVTVTTLGYGDLFPGKLPGRLLAMNEAVSSVILLVLTISFYAAASGGAVDSTKSGAGPGGID